MTRVAMEYSPAMRFPYVSRVDAGTIELVRDAGVEVVIVRRPDPAVRGAAGATRRSRRIARRRKSCIASRIRRSTSRAHGCATASRPPNTTSSSRWSAGSRTKGWSRDSAPNVSAQENAGNPHYLPTADAASRRFARTNCVLLDLWGKLATPGRGLRRHHLDGLHRPERARSDGHGVRRHLRRARRRRSTIVQDAARSRARGARLRSGPRGAHRCSIDAGYGAAILHRTGHSLGENVHGNGAHLDDYETHDERRLMPRQRVHHRAGLYFEDFGVRTEINMVWDADGPEVTGPRQKAVYSSRCSVRLEEAVCRVGKRRCSIRC